MPQSTFRFKQFTIDQDKTAMKVGTDGVLLGAWAEIPLCGKILDIGTGTGVLALISAQKSNANITAIEPDIDSYNQATHNIKNSKWANRIQIINLSLHDFVSENIFKYNFIISNPPFHGETINSPDSKRNLARNNISLPLNELIKTISELLTDDGNASIIYPFQHYNDFINLLSKYNLYLTRLTKIRPIPTKEFHRFVAQFGKIQTKFCENEITIEKGQRHHYSEEYMKLTEDFYIYFKNQ